MGGRSRAKRQKTSICAYCGEVKKITDDHVVATCLFNPAPSNPVIVDACLDCNSKKGKSDNRLRDLLMGAEATQGHADASFIRQGKMERALKAGQSEIAKELLHSPVESTRTVDGPDGPRVLYKMDVTDHFRKPLEWIVRGLYFHITKKVLSIDGGLWMSQLDDDPRITPMLFEFARGANARVSIGSTFLCFVRGDSETVWPPPRTLWMMTFFDRIGFYLDTGGHGVTPGGSPKQQAGG